MQSYNTTQIHGTKRDQAGESKVPCFHAEGKHLCVPMNGMTDVLKSASETKLTNTQ
jgi:hypothetical protein